MSENARLVVLHGGTSYHLMGVEQPPVRTLIDRAIYAPEFTPDALAGAETLVVACRTHPKHLIPHAGAIRDFLDAGKTLVAMGDTQPQLWLPNVRYAAHEPNYWWWMTEGASLGLTADTLEHSFHSFMSVADATWHHHGVFEAPPGASVLLRERGGKPIAYEDRVTTRGRMFLMSLDPIFHHGRMHIPKTTPFSQKFFAWLAEGTRSGF